MLLFTLERKGRYQLVVKQPWDIYNIDGETVVDSDCDVIDAGGDDDDTSGDTCSGLNVDKRLDFFGGM